MREDNRIKNNYRQCFIFHGKGLNYFLISLVNILLSIITLGIYMPWAMVRSRRYIYENLELNGARFGYHASGGALFLSWLLLSVLLFVLIFVAELLQPLFGIVVIFLLMLVMPFLMVKSLQYNALMTTLNTVRFAFYCPLKKAWWVMMGLPALLLVLQCAVLYGLGYMIFSRSGYHNLPLKIIILAIVGIVGMSVSNGYVYAKWMSLTGKGGQFGVHVFDIRVSVLFCIKACLFSMCILVPFIALIFWLLSTSLGSEAFMQMMGPSNDAEQMALLAAHRGQIMLAYLLYFAAILLSSAYIWQAFRNHFVNGLTLAGDSIRFASTLTFYGVVTQLALLIIVSMSTCGLAYPWMKMRFIRYQARHTWVEGDLNSIELTDHEEQVEKGFIARVSRGVMPVVPFI